MNKLAVLLLCLCLGPAFGKTVSIDLGEKNQSHGITVPSDGDGVNEAATVAGRACRQVAGGKSLYLYVQVDNAIFKPGDYTLYVTCDLYDNGPQLVGVQYDSVADTPSLASEYKHGGAMVLLGSHRWVRRTVRLDHARMGNGQNFNSDLRLNGKFAVARIEVSDEAPAGFDPDRPVPPDELAAVHTTIGKGMELCFGNDADAASALIFRAFGVTSVESYVTWQSVEDAGKGQWDWSRWDQQVKALKQAGLKWVPFLVAGPAYATPKWFREGPQHHPYVCLEHDKPSKVESLWNPALRPEIDRFLAAFADRYRDSGVIEGVLLGISGIYGESIYPAGPEGGWTAGIPGPYHNHGGWWAADDLAVAAFRRHLQEQYRTIDRLNAAWGTKFNGFEGVKTFLPEKAPNAVARADFVQWYEDSMTEWTRWWAETARKHFPHTDIYMCTGGNGTPSLGADFTAQAKAIAPYDVGIRITNEGSNYAANFAVTREVATATRFYHTFCSFEPASSVTPEGIAARIYNATASGARQLHFYTPNVLGTPAASDSFRRVASQLQRRTPPVPRVAVYLPRAAWAQDPDLIGETYAIVQAMRDYCDLDLVNRTSVADGILQHCRFLALPTNAFLEPEASAAIDRWVSNGGILLKFVDGDAAKLVRIAPDSAPPAHWTLMVGTDGDQPFLFGDWNGPENGREFPEASDLLVRNARKRWGGAHPGIYIPVQPKVPLTIELEVVTPPYALEGASGEIKLNGQVLGKLKPGNSVYRFAVPGDALSTPVAQLTFDVKSWRPSDKDGSGDQRRLSIGVTRVEAWRQHDAPAVVNRGLTVTIDSDLLVRSDKLPVQRQGKGAVISLPRPPGVALSGCLHDLLGVTAARLCGTSLLDNDAADRVYATRLDHGRLWLNMTSQPVEKAGVVVPPYGIAKSER